jgi:serine/threonine protein phosphatase 1
MSKILVRYPVNTKGRTFVIGDIHGCWELFCQLLLMIDFNPAIDIMYSTGDLCDRGPDSFKCLLLMKEPWFRAVAGNHEIFLINSVRDPGFDWAEWQRHGGNWALNITPAERHEVAILAEELPAVIVVGEGADRFNVYHAEWYGSDAKLDMLEDRRQAPVELQWGREMTERRVGPWVHEGLSTSYVGHSIFTKIRRIGNQIYIDNGGYMSLKRQSDHYALTVVEPATGKSWRSSFNPALNKE